MSKNKALSIVGIGLLAFIVTLALISFITKWKEEKAEQERLESIAQEKESLYNEYIDSIEGLVNSERYEDAENLFDLSQSVLETMNVRRIKELYQQTEKGDEFLEKLESVATENLNESINFLMKNDTELYKYYYLELITKREPNYVSEENMSLFQEYEKKHEEKEAKRKADYKARTGVSYEEARANAESYLRSQIQTGMSEGEVRRLAGSPKDRFKTSEAEFWNYGDLVLTMKNGYVFDITHSN